ncbi:hypothetical protein BV20DRAFT_1033834 [Pilatotrama ljubarskyi]|nr:hypothetical protein BV20DRAFT_1033834 [Pilatotrama ljubarskyi]
MHLVFENVIPTLVDLWTGKYKDFPGDDDFVLPPTVWKAIGEAGASSKATIPSAFGAAVPDVSGNSVKITAEHWNLWATLLAPVLLRRRFTRDVYYRHFILLIKLVRKCLQFEYTNMEIEEIAQGFIEWVKAFERLYYRYDPARLSCCTVVVHALLHIAHDIRQVGPVWVYWAFLMERFCGHLLPAIKSRRSLWQSLDNYIELDGLLRHVQVLYSLDSELDLEPQRESRRRTLTDPQCEWPIYGIKCDLPTNTIISDPNCVLVQPSRILEITPGQQTGIARCLMALFGRTVAQSRKVIPETVEHWGKLQISGGGDTIHTLKMVKRPRDGRDASFVRYQLYVDRHARNHHLEPEFEVRDFWGQLQNIFVLQLDLGRARLLGLDSPRPLFLAEIKRCRVDSVDDLGNRYYRDPLGATEVVDLNAIQCVVGRVYDTDRGRWAIIDRSGPYMEASFSSHT